MWVDFVSLAFFSKFIFQQSAQFGTKHFLFDKSSLLIARKFRYVMGERGEMLMMMAVVMAMGKKDE